MSLRVNDADHGHRERSLQVGERGGGGRVARSQDELDPLPLEIAGDLGGEPPNLGERTRPIGETGAVAEVDEVLVRHRDQALVQDGEPAGAGVEDADGSRIHCAGSVEEPSVDTHRDT